MSNGQRLAKLLEFMTVVGNLKRTVRTGWTQRNVKAPESVAEHMYRMSILSLLVTPDDDVERDRCIKLSLVHDMAESITGDITPSCGISKEEKRRQESEAMQHITSLLSPELAQELTSLHKEYESQETKEAKFVKDLDRFEMVLQAYEYEKEQQRAGDLQDFFSSTQGKFEHPTVQDWVSELCRLRQSFIDKTGAGNAS